MVPCGMAAHSAANLSAGGSRLCAATAAVALVKRGQVAAVWSIAKQWGQGILCFESVGGF